MFNEMNESYLDRLYDDFSKEQYKLMEQIKQNVSPKDEQNITKQLTLLNTLMMTVLRYRNLKKKQTLKMLE